MLMVIKNFLLGLAKFWDFYHDTSEKPSDKIKISSWKVLKYITMVRDKNILDAMW